MNSERWEESSTNTQWIRLNTGNKHSALLDGSGPNLWLWVPGVTTADGTGGQ